MNRRQQVRFGGNWYSVPLEYIGRLVTVHAYVFKVTMDYQDRIIISPVRSYGQEEEVVDSHHYLPVLLKKPGTFARAMSILKWSLPAVYEAYYRQLQERREGSEGTREYIRILMLLKDHPLQKVTAAVEQVSDSGLYGYEAVKNLLCGKSAKKICEFQPVWPNRVDHFNLLVSRKGSCTMGKSMLLEAYLKRLRLPAIGRLYQELARGPGSPGKPPL